MVGWGGLGIATSNWTHTSPDQLKRLVLARRLMSASSATKYSHDSENSDTGKAEKQRVLIRPLDALCVLEFGRDVIILVMGLYQP